MKKMNFEKGVILYLSLAIMGILFSSALGINLILSSQAKMVKNIGDSVLAFYAAETGIEKILYDASQDTDILVQCPEPNPPNPDLCRATMENNASYSISVFPSGSGGCPAGITYCVKSVGTYKTTSRAIYISR